MSDREDRELRQPPLLEPLVELKEEPKKPLPPQWPMVAFFAFIVISAALVLWFGGRL